MRSSRSTSARDGGPGYSSPLIAAECGGAPRNAAKAQAQRSCAAFALVQEVLACLALQPLGVGPLGAFDRSRGPLGGVLLGGGDWIRGRRHLDGQCAARRRVARDRRRGLGDGVKRDQGLRREKGEPACANQGRDSHPLRYSRFPIMVRLVAAQVIGATVDISSSGPRGPGSARQPQISPCAQGSLDIKICLCLTSDHSLPIAFPALLAGLEAAGEETRLRILCLLEAAELTVSELVAILGQSQPRVSRHLKLLVEAGLATRQREGAWAFFRLAESGGVLALDWLRRLDPADSVGLRRPCPARSRARGKAPAGCGLFRRARR